MFHPNSILKMWKPKHNMVTIGLYHSFTNSAHLKYISLENTKNSYKNSYKCDNDKWF